MYRLVAFGLCALCAIALGTARPAVGQVGVFSKEDLVKYTPGQIDRKRSEEIERDFGEWLKARGGELTPYQREKLLKGRTW